MNCSYRYDPPEPRAAALPRGPRARAGHAGRALPGRVLARSRHRAADRGDPVGRRRAVLVLLGYGALQAELERSRGRPGDRRPVRVLPAVPPAELLDWVASRRRRGDADPADDAQPPATRRPNKLFEAMAAGVPVVASDLPGMAPIVREIGAGLLVDPTDPAAIAAACRRILDAPPDERAERRPADPRRRPRDVQLGSADGAAARRVRAADRAAVVTRPW